MKKLFKIFLALLACMIISVGCGKKDTEFKPGVYEYYGSASDNMPSVLLQDNNTFSMVYKGQADKNIEGTYTIDNKNQTLTLNVVDSTTSDTPVYTFEIANNSIVFRNIDKPLPLYGDNTDANQVQDNTLFVNGDFDAEETTTK